MQVIPIRKRRDVTAGGTLGGTAASDDSRTKLVESNQKAIDALPLNSGTWRVAGIPGLYLRARRTSKSFYVQRRVRGKLMKESLGPLTMKEAKERAMNTWGGMKRDGSKVHVTFTQAFTAYMEQKSFADATVLNYRENFDQHLKEWHDRPIRDIGTEREDLRFFHQRLRKAHGEAKANQVRRLLSAVYNYHRDGSNDDNLPAFPKKAVPIFSLPARDWAFDDAQLRAWWHAIEETKDGKKIELGVKTLSAMKRAYWLTSLFTGARPRSIENLKWSDVDLEKRVIQFRVTKGDRPYTVPMADLLVEILSDYKASDKVAPSIWLFPSRNEDTQHVTNVKNEQQGVAPKYHLRHTFKTRLTQLGFTNEQGKLLMGHSLGGDVATGYITAPLLVESLRPVVNAIAEHYSKIVPGIVK